MIHAADDYDAIRARMDEIACVKTSGVDEVDLEWFITDHGYYVYEPISKRAVEMFAEQNYAQRPGGGYSFGYSTPDDMKKYTPTTNFVFRQRV